MSYYVKREILRKNHSTTGAKKQKITIINIINIINSHTFPFREIISIYIHYIDSVFYIIHKISIYLYTHTSYII